MKEKDAEEMERIGKKIEEALVEMIKYHLDYLKNNNPTVYRQMIEFSLKKEEPTLKERMAIVAAIQGTRMIAGMRYNALLSNVLLRQEQDSDPIIVLLASLKFLELQSSDGIVGEFLANSIREVVRKIYNTAEN